MPRNNGMARYSGISRRTLVVTIMAIIAIAAVTGAVLAWRFAINSSSNHSPSSTTTVLQGPWTNDNPLGFHTKVAYVQNPTDVSCPFQPCQPAPAYMLKYISEKQSFLLGYSICNGGGGDNNCISRDQFSSPALSDPGLIGKSPEVWSSLRLGEDLHWKPGDTVDIKVKVAPAQIKDDNNSNNATPDVEKTMYLDLGDSTIISLERG